MAIGLIANSKSALMFAGGVIVLAVLAAGGLGDRFTPATEPVEIAEAGAPGDRTERAVASTSSQNTASADQDDESVFGEYEGYSDADLIDNTQGFDPTPGDYSYSDTDAATDVVRKASPRISADVKGASPTRSKRSPVAQPKPAAASRAASQGGSRRRTREEYNALPAASESDDP